MALKTQRAKNKRTKAASGSAATADVYQDGTAASGESESFQPSAPSESERTVGKKAPGKRGKQVGNQV